MLSPPPLGEEVKTCASASPADIQVRKVRFALQDLAGGLDPVVHERRLHLRNRGPFDAVVRVAPVLRRFGVAIPVVGDTDAAGEADLAVHDQELAVRAVVHAREVVPAKWMVVLYLDTRGYHAVDEAGLHFLAADPVDQDMDRDAGLRALGQGIDECAADLARPVDVRLEADGLLRALDGGEHRGKYLGAVLEVRDAVAVADRRPEQGAELVQELRIVDRVMVLELALDALFTGREIEREDGHDAREQRANKAGDQQHFLVHPFQGH